MKKILYTYLMLMSTITVFGQDSSYNLNINRIPISSLQTLLQQPNAVSGGLGESGVANTNDPLGFMLNVAKASYISKERKHLFGAYYAPHESQLIKQQNYAAINGISRLSEKEVLFYQVFNFKNLSSEIRDADGNLLSISSGNDFYAKVGLSKDLGYGSSLGLGLGYYRSSQLYSMYKPARGANFDIGYIKSWKYKIDASDDIYGYSNIGVSVSNIGGKVKYGDNKSMSFAPMRFRMGYSYISKINDILHVFAFDVDKDLIPTPNNTLDYYNKNSMSYLFSSWSDAPDGFKEEIKEMRLHFGYELNYKILSGRFGYSHENASKGDKRSLTFGLGLNQISLGNHNLRIDGSYAFRLGTGVTSIFKLGVIFELFKEKESSEAINGMGTTY